MDGCYVEAVNRDVKNESLCGDFFEFEGMAAEDIPLQMQHPATALLLHLLIDVMIRVQIGEFPPHPHFALALASFILLQQSPEPLHALPPLLLALRQTVQGGLLEVGELGADESHLFPLCVQFLLVFGEFALSGRGGTVR